MLVCATVCVLLVESRKCLVRYVLTAIISYTPENMSRHFNGKLELGIREHRHT